LRIQIDQVVFRLERERRVLQRIRSTVIECPVVDPFIAVEPAIAFPEIALEKDGIDLFDHCIKTRILVIQKHARVSLSWRSNSHLSKELHRHSFMHRGRLLGIGAENEVSQTEKSVPALVAAEVDLE